MAHSTPSVAAAYSRANEPVAFSRNNKETRHLAYYLHKCKLMIFLMGKLQAWGCSRKWGKVINSSNTRVPDIIFFLF